MEGADSLPQVYINDAFGLLGLPAVRLATELNSRRLLRAIYSGGVLDWSGLAAWLRGLRLVAGIGLRLLVPFIRRLLARQPARIGIVIRLLLGELHRLHRPGGLRAGLVLRQRLAGIAQAGRRGGRLGVGIALHVPHRHRLGGVLGVSGSAVRPHQALHLVLLEDLRRFAHAWRLPRESPGCR